jgi:hypothetical protein
MINIQQRLFWLLVLLAQVSIIVLPFTSFYSSLGISSPRFFTFIFQVAFCIPLVLIASQKKLLRHNFWAGFFGVSVASLMLGLLSFLSLFSQSFSSQAFGYLAFVFVIQVTCVFGQFIYVYSSPHLWQSA